MTDPEIIPLATAKATRRTWRTVLVLAGVTVALILVVAYGGRRVIAREALTGWLRSQGVESQVAFATFGPGGFTGTLRIGPAANPDLTAQVAEVRYGLTGWWAGKPFGATVTAVRLVRPVIKGRWTNGRLSLGALDPLIETLRKRPPRPDARQPRIVVEDARLRLDTDYGPLLARASALLDNGRLLRLDTTFAPTTLQGHDRSVRLGPGELHLVTEGDQVSSTLETTIRDLKLGQVTVQEATIRLTARTAYPDLKQKRGDGALTQVLKVDARSVAHGTTRLRDVSLEATFNGQSAGWIDTLAITGDGAAVLGAARADLAGARVRGLRMTANVGGLNWTRRGGDRVAASLATRVRAEALTKDKLALTRLSGALRGSAVLAAEGGDLALAGTVATHGDWSGLGPVSAGDAPQIAALKRAVRSFDAETLGLSVTAGEGGLTLALTSPLTVRPTAGGLATISARGRRPIHAGGGGALNLAVSGGGLPQVDLAVDRYRLTAGGLTAQTHVKAELGVGPVRDGKVTADGELRIADGAIAFTASRCAPVSGRLELGTNGVEALETQLCPTGAPLFTLAKGDWRIRADATSLSAKVPFLQAAVSQGAGRLDLGAVDGGLAGSLALTSGMITDTTPDLRFNPVRATALARVSGEVWTADIGVTDPAGHALGKGGLGHDGATGGGTLTFDTGTLTFAEGGLQPAALSPRAEMVGSPAAGQARFQGQVSWTKAGSTSGGTLDIPGLDFRSPAGQVSGLSGSVTFTSLAPLTAAPGQTLKAQRIEALAGLTTAQVTFGIADEAVNVAGLDMALAGGQVHVEPFSLPFAGGQSWKGVVGFEDVQLSDLVEASPFANRMDLTARASGTIPFTVTPDGVRIVGGTLRATGPGRLSIRRDALTGVAADGALAAGPLGDETPPPETDTFTDFAYQAMENLAFQSLDASINSLPRGRLGMLFHIKGENAPPTHQEIWLTPLEILTRSFLTKKLPLPSGTKVDLTLDSSLNLDQLLGDFAEYQKLRGSDAVQPNLAKPNP
ncbi:YdbH domain-containing protein [Phenylobacterium sp.]|uniref:intermembrane phospholipid transport protein YdbH family protein n=1 Tax=Phenylobacterium sp. TaxID=1871053 RepID=UPI0030F3B21C